MSALVRARHLRALAGAGAVLAVLLLAHLPGAAAGLAYLGPLLFALLALWLGRYPGERVLLALSGASGRRRRAAAQRLRGHAVMTMPRGGALIATALAGRAPPAVDGLV